jgi:hypothetical protein
MEVIAVHTGMRSSSDSGLHTDGTHHLLLVTKGTRTVFMYKPAVNDHTCPLLSLELEEKSAPIPVDLFDQNYEQFGFERVEVHAGDAILIERYRAHRVIGHPGSSGIILPVSILEWGFDGHGL